MSKCTAAEAVAEMEYWIGYYEKASGSYATTPDKSAFEKNKGSANYTYFGYVCGVQGQPWCAATISTVMLRACGGSQADAKAVLHGVWPYVNCAQVWDAAPDNMKYWSHYQRWTLGKGVRQTYKPIAGDIIVFTDDTKTRSHTGLVYACDGTYVYTIEGNSGNMCRKRSYRLTSAYIYGWIRPVYAAGGAEVTTTVEQYGAALDMGLHVLSKGCAGPEVETLQIMLNGRSTAGLEVDGGFGNATETAVEAYQEANGLYKDGVAGKQTLTHLMTGRKS